MLFTCYADVCAVVDLWRAFFVGFICCSNVWIYVGCCMLFCLFGVCCYGGCCVVYLFFCGAFFILLFRCGLLQGLLVAVSVIPIYGLVGAVGCCFTCWSDGHTVLGVFVFTFACLEVFAFVDFCRGCCVLFLRLPIAFVYAIRASCCVVDTRWPLSLETSSL